jgi:hypothetical protein
MVAQIIQSWKRLNPFAKLAGAVGFVGLLGFAFWTITPLFYSTRIDEEFPQAAMAAAAPTAMAEPSAMSEAMAKPSGMVEPTVVAEPTAAPTVVAEPTAAPTVVAEPTAAPTVVAEPTAAPTAEPTAAPTAEPTAAPTAAPAGPVALATGSFTRVDRLHSAEGSATVYRLADGQLILRLENFAAQNGPDLYVGFSGHPIPRSNGELMDNGYLELGRLKASSGNQNYELPADFDLSQFKSVTIYCRAFSVVFSTAELMG